MKTLLHVCCAPCSIVCIDTLRQEGIEPVGYWYNPNIHPMKEYKMRKNTMVEYAKSIGMKLEVNNEYGLRLFIEGVYPDFDRRCGFCYALRFDETARYAAEHGYDCFTSTLFVSPYQNQGLMRETAERAAAKYGVQYLHRDFSPRFHEGQDKARELGLYMQNYCGCVFSEEDRYRKRPKKKKAEAGA
ncbi:MAG: epoxyqueuosine reductase QueH [Agathobaculum sp.]|uniref:epoxyqueuosine reductase QueH n=1 Tax=Agathobaculum sp. TaxID=2048138 RepID=UPI0025C3E715|nr:epoxyqueuosine reductase QueH [Agathobaculum sp.]MCI7125022.1 epoxyqueuosine reductase QueH [Agathobaculum sp.]MDY3710899.1 epoxyqueuosine reductase QueH [Agathobaculum sp.]